MLRITQQSSAKDAQRYYASADYYSEGQELIGSWGGKTAEMLGLSGVVDKASFDRLCENRHPKDGSKLTARTKSQRTVGYDFTFSVPKSVSLLHATCDDPRILDAFRASVGETMQEIESEMKTRVRIKGKDVDRETRNMVWAEFIHNTSRPVEGIPDPQLHAHVFAFNCTHDPHEGRFKAGQFRDLKRDAPYFQAAFRVRLAGKLQELGYGIDRTRDDFEVRGVPLSAVRKFSRRTEEIERIADERGIIDPKRKAELGQATRQKKSKDLPWEKLREEWRNRLTTNERTAIETAFYQARGSGKETGGEKLAVDYALDHCFVRQAVLPERSILTEALKRGIGSVDLETVKGELFLRPLIRGERDGRRLATSQGMLSAETKLVAYAKEGRGRFQPLADADRPIKREWLNAGQTAAVKHVLGSRDAVTVLRGAAGTGKTSLEAELREAFEEGGVPVVAMAQTTGATDELRSKEGAGFKDAMTIARFLLDKESQSSVQGGAILIDEASFLGTSDMLRLFDIARAQEARVILVGDRHQHRSVLAGEPLKLLEERAGLPVAEVTEIVRQTHGGYKKAAEALSEGRIEDAFEQLERLGWIKEVADDKRYQALADAYLAASRERKKNGDPKTALVVTPTHAEAKRINDTIRSELLSKGKLGDERSFGIWIPAQLTDPQKTDAVNYEPGDLLKFHKNAPGHKSGSRLLVAEGKELPLEHAKRFEVYRPADIKLAAGDRIRITAGGKDKSGKHTLANGSLRTVKGFTPRGDIITDQGWVIAKEWGHIAHGYAVTSHSSQGKTVDKLVLGISSQSFAATNERTAYVSGTRGKEQVQIFTDDKKALLQAVSRPDRPMSAMELAESRRSSGLRLRLKRHLAAMRRIFDNLPSMDHRRDGKEQDRSQER